MKKRALFIIAFSVIIGILFIVQKVNVKDETEIVQWNSPEESTTLDFFVGKSGHLFLKGRVNGFTGLFLFDTGADNSFLHEKYITKEDLKLDSCTIMDAKNIRLTRNLYKVPSLELGTIKIKDLVVFPLDSLSWIDRKGMFYNQDSVVGVIGNNIIWKFIWDFDMINRRVTVSKSRNYCNSLPDSLAISMIDVEKHKEIMVHINGKLKRLSLDFGCSSPISLSGPIPITKKSKETGIYSTKTSSALAHLRPQESTDSNFDFADVKFGPYEFKEIQCFENDDSALFGIPFVWSFKRVVIDFKNDKAYFISLNESTRDFGVMKFNRQYVYNSDGVTIYHSRPKGITLETTNSSGRFIYVGFGEVMLYSKNGNQDSIFCQDSIRLPDGKIKVGPVTVRIDSINKSRNRK